MVSFISKKIEGESNLGVNLRVAREKKGLSLDMAAVATGIGAKYLNAFEENDFSSLPQGIYRDKFLRRYSEFLGVEEKNILLFPLNEPSGVQEELYKLKIGKQSLLRKIKDFILNPAFLRNTAILALVFGCMAYLYFIGYNIVSPPSLAIISPSDDFVTNEFLVEVEGKTEEEAKVFINDKEIYCLQEGSFSEEIDLKKGINIVKISAKKKYSKEKAVYRKILVTGGEAVTMK